MKRKEIAVIGGGIIGAAVAARLVQGSPENRVTVYEKEQTAAQHQTGHNSGVVHAGLYYPPGSLKAQLTRRGVTLLNEYCDENSIGYEKCGKLVVAHSNGQLGLLDDVFAKAKQNQVPGIRLVDQEQIRQIEPHSEGVAALHSPETAIIDYPALTNSLLEDVRRGGGDVRFGERVNRISERRGRHIVETDGEKEDYDFVIVCNGLQSDRLARRSGAGRFPLIVPFSGDYYQLNPEKVNLVRGLLYPVPDPAYPFLGVHLTKTIDGRVTVGPNAFLAFSRETYRKLSFNLQDAFDIATSAAFWRFSAANLPAAVDQLKSASKGAFVRGAQAFIPELSRSDLLPGPRGVRAQAMNRDGSLVDDFVIQRSGNCVFVRNAPSPAATSSLAIAEHIVETVLSDDKLG